MFPSNDQGFGSRKEGVYIHKYLDPNLITFLSSDTREEVLKDLVDLLVVQKKVHDKQEFLKAILDRENIVSTGIGVGVAVPHAKLKGYDSFFIALGIHSRGVAWDSLDGVPVRLIFMIGGPDDKQSEYLQLLSRLTFAIKDEERRKKILQTRSLQDIIALFKGI